MHGNDTLTNDSSNRQTKQSGNSRWWRLGDMCGSCRGHGQIYIQDRQTGRTDGAAVPRGWPRALPAPRQHMATHSSPCESDMSWDGRTGHGTVRVNMGWHGAHCTARHGMGWCGTEWSGDRHGTGQGMTRHEKHSSKRRGAASDGTWSGE